MTATKIEYSGRIRSRAAGAPGRHDVVRATAMSTCALEDLPMLAQAITPNLVRHEQISAPRGANQPTRSRRDEVRRSSSARSGHPRAGGPHHHARS